MRVLLLTLPILSLVAADKPAAEKLSVNHEIPLWEESKVPLSKGDSDLDKPFLTVFLPPEGKRNSGSVVVAPRAAHFAWCGEAAYSLTRSICGRTPGRRPGLLSWPTECWAFGPCANPSPATRFGDNRPC